MQHSVQAARVSKFLMRPSAIACQRGYCCAMAAAPPRFIHSKTATGRRRSHLFTRRHGLDVLHDVGRCRVPLRPPLRHASSSDRLPRPTAAAGRERLLVLPHLDGLAAD